MLGCVRRQRLKLDIEGLVDRILVWSGGIRQCSLKWTLASKCVKQGPSVILLATINFAVMCRTYYMLRDIWEGKLNNIIEFTSDCVCHALWHWKAQSDCVRMNIVPLFRTV